MTIGIDQAIMALFPQITINDFASSRVGLKDDGNGVQYIDQNIWTRNFPTIPVPSIAQLKAKAALLQTDSDFVDAQTSQTTNLASNYINAQLVNVVLQQYSNHTFSVSIQENELAKLERQLFGANITGSATWLAQDVTGVLRSHNLSLLAWRQFYSGAKPLAVSNLTIFKRQQILINSAATIDQVNAIDTSMGLFPTTQTITVIAS